MDALPVLTDGNLLDGGGWDARFARVLRRAVAGRAALAVVDSNGDGAELEADVWEYEGGRWQPGGSSSLGSLDARGGESTGRSGHVVWAAGLLEVGSSVRVRYGDDEQPVAADSDGLWAWVRYDDGTAAVGNGWPSVSYGLV